MSDLGSVPQELVLAQREACGEPVDTAEIAQVMAKLARSYAQKKINRSLYRRQRKALLDFFNGELSSFPELCFNEFSQHAGESPEHPSDGVFSKLAKVSSTIGSGRQPAKNKGNMPAFISLLLGGLIGVLFILFFG